MSLLRASVFVHVLTAIHAVGAIACFLMAAGGAVSTGFTNALAVSGAASR